MASGKRLRWRSGGAGTPQPRPGSAHRTRGGLGRIIGLTSGGDLGFPEEVSYGAAKAAQANYTMSAALELARYGITANMWAVVLRCRGDGGR